jgi:hypothetical protein
VRCRCLYGWLKYPRPLDVGLGIALCDLWIPLLRPGLSGRACVTSVPIEPLFRERGGDLKRYLNRVGLVFPRLLCC